MRSGSNFPLTARVQNVSSYKKSDLRRPIDLRLDKNESIAAEVQLVLDGQPLPTKCFNQYPDDSALRRNIADEFELQPDEVLITAGADDALDRICRILVEPGRNVVLPVPTFEMIERYVALAGGEAKKVIWQHGSFPDEDVLAAVDGNTSAIFMVTPNNPTGAVAVTEDLQRIAQQIPQCALILDLAYAEFAEPLSNALLQIPNLIVTRTFSKAWGMAGLRVGYALAAKPVIEAMSAAAGPYPVSAISLEIARRHWNQRRQEMSNRVGQVADLREELQKALSQAKLNPQPSQANFVLCRPPNPQWICDGFAGMGIGVRSFEDRPELAGSVRVGCPTQPAELSRVKDAMKTITQPETILFDMDGVLADVSESFRVAIIKTCCEFGVEVNRQQIESLKLAGGFNNDWVVTQALLRESGKEVTVEEVREVFDRIYLGDPIGTGLCAQEKLLVSKSMLRSLANRLPLAIVTGRPRADAQMFLDQFGLTEIFTAVVAMEDAPSKPDPTPVLMAMEQLNVQRAWMIGDTVDDIRAARAANVLPLGVIAPGSDLVRQETALLQAGAARVLRNAEFLVELLP